jgi:hypothetical protein
MSDIFTPVELVWAGKVHTVAPNRVMGLISQIEDVLTLSELQGYAARGTAPMGKLCMAYGKALRYAGLSISDDAVYASAFDGAEEQAIISGALINLMKMMLPASARARFDKAYDDIEKGTQTGNLPPAAAGSSKRRSSSAVGRKTGAARG